MRVAILCLMLCGGCGLFTAGGVVSAVTQVIGELTKLAKAKGYGDLNQYPIECEHEQVPATDTAPAQLLMLCTVTLEKPNG